MSVGGAEHRLLAIGRLGQAIWLDDLSRELLVGGALERLIDDDGLSGVTSNPTIFERAIAHSELYDDELRAAAAEGLDARATFFRLALDDVRAAADLLRPVHDRTGAKDGYVSFELLPELAHDPDGSITAATRIAREIDRPNTLIKVPGTSEGVRAFEELTAAGVSINVTLLFAVSRYEQIVEAYLRGLERRVDAGAAIDGISSVASFFVSRVDAKVDAELAARGRDDLAGRAGVANAKLAYRAFGQHFSGPRWERLARQGANVQRPLWASTSTKDPRYPDLLYVDNLIGPDTVNTMPMATLDAARDHATVRRTVDEGVDEAARTIDELVAIGVPFARICEQDLVADGIRAFADSFDQLVATLTEKAAGPNRLRPAPAR